MADLTFISENNNYIVDVTSHRMDTDFNMPNLTSVERLTKLYKDNRNYFVIFFIEYRIINQKIHIHKVSIFPIEFLSWECLPLGALGWGQIQIKNSNFVKIEPCSRKEWILYLCDILIKSFYPKEASKIIQRQQHFNEIRELWMGQE